MRLGESILAIIIVFFTGFIVLDISGYIPWNLISPYGNSTPPAGVYWTFAWLIIMFIIIGVVAFVFYLILHHGEA